MRALVTGAAGFIGSTLVDRLLAAGHQVVGVDNFSTGISSNLEQALDRDVPSPRFTLVPLDIQAPELVDVVAGANPDVLFHLAAQADVDTSLSDPLHDARSNVLGTINVCEASREVGVRRIVYATSDEEYPLSPHAAAKHSGELYLRAYAHRYGSAPICLALTNVYGPRQIPRYPADVIATVAAMTINRRYSLPQDGTVAHDYIYVDDVVDAFVLAGCAPPEASGTYRIGSGLRMTATEVHDLISAALDREGSNSVARCLDFHPNALNMRRAANEFGWEPKVFMAEGIQRTIDWLYARPEPEQPELLGA